jgi:NADH dehydrogenase FAD-containing subunit
VIVGGGPTGVELAGALAEIARQSLRQDFRNIHPESARIMVLEGSPYPLAAFPDSLREAARRSLEVLFLHIFWLIGFRIAVLSEGAWAYITLQRRVRLITGEELGPRS